MKIMKIIKKSERLKSIKLIFKEEYGGFSNIDPSLSLCNIMNNIQNLKDLQKLTLDLKY